MPDVKDMWDLLWDVHEKTKGTSWETIFPAVVIAAVIFLAVKFVIIPLAKYIIRLYKCISTNLFIKKKVYKGLSFMDSKDVYYAINNFIPTRFSATDPSNNDEPAPEYTVSGTEKKGREKEPLLIERFIKYEYSMKEGKKYYLCLGDCGMGKTTFLINLYYQTLKQHKYKCAFISLQEEDCIKRIEEIEDKSETILLLDALDENDSAVANYSEFADRLEKATRNFYRVIITARTNFFESEVNEKLTNNRNGTSVSSKLSSSGKFYITPFTDEDIRKYLKIKYHFSRRKMKQAWYVIEQNKNLSVRPLLLKFMDEIIVENRRFVYDFELYEFLFGKWIERERRSIDEELGKDLYDECLNLAKQIYYNWMKNGSIGIYPEDTWESGMAGIKAIKLKGHAMLNRTSDGMYKFSHKSYWEFLLAKLALTDIQFANELYIKNFDRANEFLGEMISYNHLNNEKSDFKTIICEADYMLKYETPSRAEIKYRSAAENSTFGSWDYIIAMTKLSESLLRQLKEEAAKEAVYEAYEAIKDLEFDREHLQYFTEFACAFSQISRVYKIADGQKYLEKLIAYYRQNRISNYALLRCYNEYSRCCMNYKLKHDTVKEMEDIINSSFGNDQYADYLLSEAKSWKMSFEDFNLQKTLGKMLDQYSRFMDTYELIVNNCDMAVAIFAYDVEYSSFDAEKNLAYSYFEEAYYLSEDIYRYDDSKPLKPGAVIYEDDSEDILNNAYMFFVHRKIFQAFSYTDVIRLSELAKPMLEYIDSKGLQWERPLTCIYLYRYIGRDDKEDFKKCEEYLLKALNLAESIDNKYYIADICKMLFWLYDENEKYDDSKKWLYRAYKELGEDEGLRNTSEYCSILKLMIENTDDSNEEMVKQLLETARKVYGDDSRKRSIYSFLYKYYRNNNNKCLIEISTELLKCNFNYDNIENLFDSCIMNGEKNSFGVILNAIIIDSNLISEDEYQALEAFLKNRGQELDTDVIKFLNAAVSKVSRSNRRKPDDNSYIAVKGNAGSGKTRSLIRYENSMGITRLSPYMNFIVDRAKEEERKREAELIDIQKELERQFEELFGSIDYEAENDEPNSETIPMFVRESAVTDSKAENDEPN